MNVILLDFSSVREPRESIALLAERIAVHGHNVCLLAHGAQQYDEHDGVELLSLALSGFFAYDYSLKGRWHLFQLCGRVHKAIRQQNPGGFDLVIAVEPPPTAHRLLAQLLRGHACGYAVVGDPPLDRAVETGVLHARSIAYRHYARSECATYALFLHIACAGAAARSALLMRCPELPAAHVTTAPAFAVPGDYPEPFDKDAARARFELPHDAAVCVYDGPITTAGGMDFLREVLTYFNRSSDVFFVVTGDGDRQDELRRHIEQDKQACARFFTPPLRDEHVELLRACDIGLVLRAHDAAPCPPSHALPYIDLSLPVLAAGAVDDVAVLLEQAQCGFATTEHDPKDFLRHLNVLVKSREQREQMGRRGRRWLDCEWTADNAAKAILAQIDVR